MQIVICKTPEIGDTRWEQIVAGFAESFDCAATRTELERSYVSNPHGYSYHAICTDGEKIVGFNSIVPFDYLHDGERITLGLSGSTYVLKAYRKDIFIFHDLYMALREHCAAEGIPVFLGVPNDNSYQYSIKLLRCRDIGRLPYHILPVRAFNLLSAGRRLKWLNWTSQAYAVAALAACRLLAGVLNWRQRPTPYGIAADETFLDTRFSAPRYRTLTSGRMRATYTLADEGAMRVAYIMDFREQSRKTFRALAWIAWKIYFREHVDAIAYVGTMNVKQCLLTRVPVRFEPKRLPLTYNMLTKDPGGRYADIRELRNWDFSLMNLDVR